MHGLGIHVYRMSLTYTSFIHLPKKQGDDHTLADKGCVFEAHCIMPPQKAVFVLNAIGSSYCTFKEAIHMYDIEA